MSLVFQYGSNASSAQINSSCRLGGAAKLVGLVYTKEKFDFDFTHWSKCNNCATADITPGGERNIYGVLYDIPDERIFRHMGKGRITLDEIEGECTSYCRIKIQVIQISKQDNLRDALTYVVKNPQKGLKTETSYVRHIISGLCEHGAPEEYIQYIKDRAAESNPPIAHELAGL